FAQRTRRKDRRNGLRKREQAAIEAVAGHFSATWEKGEGPPDAYIASARKRKPVPTRPASDRWLVVANEDGFPQVETYRHVCSQRSIPAGFKKLLMVFAGGRVETLAG